MKVSADSIPEPIVNAVLISLSIQDRCSFLQSSLVCTRWEKLGREARKVIIQAIVSNKAISRMIEETPTMNTLTRKKIEAAHGQFVNEEGIAKLARLDG